MGMIKKGLLVLTSSFMALGIAAVPVFAEETAEETTAGSETQKENSEEVEKQESKESSESTEKKYTAGVTVVKNTEHPEWDGDYLATFVYEAPEGTKGVSIIGNFQFYYAEEVESYVKGEAFKTYTPYEYKHGMYNTGYDVAQYGYSPLEMQKIQDNLYTITLPLPGNEYFYDFVVTDENDNTTTIKDPANLPFSNNGADSGHSLVFIGNPENCMEGQSYIYPRTDELKGSVEYIDYTDVNGDTRTVGVYLPYGYSQSKQYKVLYLCHGGGGNEVEWYNIGAASNIFDNLIAEGALEPTIIVTMNNQVYNFEKGPAVKNILENIIPLINKKYSVSTAKEDRAIAGLSSGASVTVQMALEATDQFDYYGIFSPSRTLNFIKDEAGNNTITAEQKEAFKNVEQFYVSVGEFDSFVRRDVNVDVYDELKADEANAVFEWKPGAHDWGVWRNQLTEFAKNYLWHVNQEVISGSEKVFVVGDDWGPAVNKVMLTLDEEVNASDLDPTTFTVKETKESTNWADFSVYNATALRTVLDVYLSDDKGNKVDAQKGNVVTVEMYISPNEGSPFRYDLQTGSNKWVNHYQLKVNGKAKDKMINVDQVLDLKDHSNWVTDAAEKFDVTKTFTGSDGIVMPYGQYTPKSNGKKKALVVWLHGAGEGVGAAGNYGNDNYVDLLGNEVTALVSDEFQKLYDGGAYVITPQAQTMWMDGGDGKYQNGDKGSMYEKTLFELIQNVVKNNPEIDPDRIIIGGCSNGGYMTMEMVLKHPDYFLKAYPICEAFYDEFITDDMLKAVKKGGTEFWFTYAKNDTTVDPTLTAMPTIKRMQKLGIPVHTSVWDDVHDTTGRFWLDEDGQLTSEKTGIPYQYMGHWSWIYFDNNSNICDDCKKNEWKWMAEYSPKKEETVKKDDPKKDTKQKKDDKKSVKTSDNSHAVFYAGTFFMTMIALAGVVVLKKKFHE